MSSRVASMLCIATLLLTVACAVPGNAREAGSMRGAEQGSYQRFIVKYREGTAAARQTDAVQRKLQATAPEGVSLAWQRRLGVQADLFTTDRPLDAAEAEALMRRFRADPEVEYIEVDGMMGIGPVRPPVMRQPLED